MSTNLVDVASEAAREPATGLTASRGAARATHRQATRRRMDPPRWTGSPSPRRLLLAFALIFGAPLLACSSSDDDHGHEDAPIADAAVSTDADAPGAVDARGDAGTVVEPSPSPCVPACGSLQVCCVDQHGHFPRCVDGAVCAPPLGPPGG
jgi:hypothetical protein